MNDSKQKFTPGPWTVISGGSEPSVYKKRGADGDGLLRIAYVDHCFSMLPDLSEPAWTEASDQMRNANARLIAAAPDMLAALKAFNIKEEWIVSGTADTITLRVPFAVIQQAAAAVSKAEAAS